eukprot:1814976-Rhodomonas_salina.2
MLCSCAMILCYAPMLCSYAIAGVLYCYGMLLRYAVLTCYAPMLYFCAVFMLRYAATMYCYAMLLHYNATPVCCYGMLLRAVNVRSGVLREAGRGTREQRRSVRGGGGYGGGVCRSWYPPLPLGP